MIFKFNENEVDLMYDYDLEISLNKLGLKDSGIGVFWIKKENGKFIYYHTEYSANLYRLSLSDLPPSIIFGEKWEATAKEVYKRNPSFENLVVNSKKELLKVTRGELSHAKYSSPWLDSDNKEIWVSDKVYIVDYDTDRTAKTIVGITVNETIRSSRREKYQEIEEINIKLRSAEERAIQLAGFLVWSMNFEEFPNGDYIFSNDLYKKTLGLKNDSNGYIMFDDFVRTKYDDSKEKDSMGYLQGEFDKANKFSSYNYFETLTKHKNLITNETLYLKHHTNVDERYIDGSIKRVSGYIVDFTSQINMEKEYEELDLKNKNLLLAQKLAFDSGQVMIWYLNNATAPKKDYFYGNPKLFEKLGLPIHSKEFFLIDEFNQTIYTKDEEGLKLYNEYMKMEKLIDSNHIQQYSRVLVKHINLVTNELLYFEHNFIVDERNIDKSLRIRGGYMNDVTKETLYKNEIEYLVKHDAVTGLRNRNMFEEFIHSKSSPKNYTVIVLDIDGLKFINDAYGHIWGDKAIKITSDLLKEIFLDTSNLYRVGGDEFTVISQVTDSKKIETMIKELKMRILEKTEFSQLVFNVSVGYEVVKNNDIDFDLAFTTAENIMYRRKLGIRNSRKSQTMETVLQTLNTKTEETKDHCDRLGDYAVKVLKSMGYTRISDLEDIILLCKLHDVGKITISEELLSKSTSLTDAEYSRIKTHSEAGYKIVKNIVESDDIANAVLYHHERVDGKGYPFGLKGDEIPLYAKIVSICDAYDVMVEGRVYQTKRTHEEAINEIVKCSGTQFDSKLVDIFKNIF